MCPLSFGGAQKSSVMSSGRPREIAMPPSQQLRACGNRGRCGGDVTRGLNAARCSPPTSYACASITERTVCLQPRRIWMSSRVVSESRTRSNVDPLVCHVTRCSHASQCTWSQHTPHANTYARARARKITDGRMVTSRKHGENDVRARERE